MDAYLENEVKDDSRQTTKYDINKQDQRRSNHYSGCYKDDEWYDECSCYHRAKYQKYSKCKCHVQAKICRVYY